MSMRRTDADFLQLAYLHGINRSEDPSRKIGCVIADVERDYVIGTGVNEFPIGVERKPERYERPAKYQWTEHAERNAIFDAARAGRPLKGATAYVPWFPCVECARALIQVRVGTVVVSQEPDLSDTVYGFAIAAQMFKEAGVNVLVVPGIVPVQERKA